LAEPGSVMSRSVRRFLHWWKLITVARLMRQFILAQSVSKNETRGANAPA
jgi:hypothetical protein